MTGKVGTSAVISEIDGIDKTEIGEITIDKVEAFKSAQSYGRALRNHLLSGYSVSRENILHRSPDLYGVEVERRSGRP